MAAMQRGRSSQTEVVGSVLCSLNVFEQDIEHCAPLECIFDVVMCT